MNPTAPITPGDRTRAVRRLRTLTIRTALAGLAAVGGFGYLAALTFAGNKTATTAVVTATPSTTPSATSNSGTSNPTSAATPTPTPTLQAATPAPTTSRSQAHVTTGGS